jgi:phospholipid/cholesterol/gamma-HCH transport system permease protein
MSPSDFFDYDNNEQRLICQGDWTLVNIPRIKHLLKKIVLPTSGKFIIDGSKIHKFDSAGAWILIHLKKNLQKKGVHTELENFSEQLQKLITLVKNKLEKEKEPEITPKLNWPARVGQQTIQQLNGFRLYLNFIGQLSYEVKRLFFYPKHWRWNSVASVIFHGGYQALPIIAILSFMIGIVITYQMGLQLRRYGANIYIVDLIGFSILREFSPLITAIMVAGRTGSSFTAQLGIMKINQEVDALSTIGVTPAELLLLPRIAGLFIALPLITMWSNIFGIVGGMVMANGMLHISWYDFLHRFPSVVPLRALIIGIGKAPIFALIIASIGCYQGMQVNGSATSVGQNTTRSVVLAIFFIILADALFSIIFSKLHL